jgi:hypothetical protein
MAIATVVMMYTGWQQTRIAKATIKLTEDQEEVRLLQSKKELRKVAHKILESLSDGRGIREPGSRQECEEAARQVCTLMDSVSDNYYLLNNRVEARTWEEMINSYAIYLKLGLSNPDFQWGVDNKVLTGADADNCIRKDFLKTNEHWFGVLLRLYGKLHLFPLVTENPKK